MRRISSHLLLTRSGLERGKIVTLTDEGVVAAVEDVGPRGLDAMPGVEFFPGILAPGFWNAHCHLELSGIRGVIPPGGGFAEFAKGMRKSRGGVVSTAGAMEFWDARMWAGGVSVVDDVCNGAESFGVKAASRIRYLNHCELFGLGADSERAFGLCTAARAAGLEASVTPHSVYSLNKRDFSAVSGKGEVTVSPNRAGKSSSLAELCTAAIELGTTGSATQSEAPGRPTTQFATPQDESEASVTAERLTIHFLESEQEIDLFRKRGPLWDWYCEQGLEPDFLDFGGPAERLVAQTPRDREVLLVHNCCLTQRDIDIVMGHFTAPVTWVVCPRSNRYIGGEGARPPIDLMRKNGLRIAVGTDSLASNETLDMIAELSEIQGVPLHEKLSWIAAGTIEEGHAPGLVNITGVDLQKIGLTERSKSHRIL